MFYILVFFQAVTDLDPHFHDIFGPYESNEEAKSELRNQGWKTFDTLGTGWKKEGKDGVFRASVRPLHVLTQERI